MSGPTAWANDLIAAEGGQVENDQGFTVPQLIAAYEHLRKVKAAAEQARKGVLALLDPLMGYDRYETDTGVWWMGRAKRRQIIDPSALIDFLADDWAEVIPVTKSSRVKVTGLRKVARSRGMDADMVEDTFCTVKLAPTSLNWRAK